MQASLGGIDGRPHDIFGREDLNWQSKNSLGLLSLKMRASRVEFCEEEDGSLLLGLRLICEKFVCHILYFRLQTPVCLIQIPFSFETFCGIGVGSIPFVAFG